MNTKSWRLNKEEYIDERRRVLKLNESVDEWAAISLNGALSRKEVMVRIMMDNDPELPTNSYICQAYMCEGYDFDEAFLSDIIYVNSGLCLLGFWDNKVIKWVLRLHKDCISKTASVANVFEEVKLAVDKEYFIATPEYHEFLKQFLVEYNDLCDKLLSTKKPKTRDIDELAKYYIQMSEISAKVKSYYIPIKDRLDWDAIHANVGLSSSFLQDHSKTSGPTGGVRPLKDKDFSGEDYISPKSRKYMVRKQSGKNVRKLAIK